jgi:hypothetical protein
MFLLGLGYNERKAFFPGRSVEGRLECMHRFTHYLHLCLIL